MIGSICPHCRGRGRITRPTPHSLTSQPVVACRYSTRADDGRSYICVSGQMHLYTPALRAVDTQPGPWEPRHVLSVEETEVSQHSDAKVLIAASIGEDQTMLCQILPDVPEEDPDSRNPASIGIVEAERYARLFAASPLMLTTLRQILSIHRASQHSEEGRLTPNMAVFIERALTEATGEKP